MDLKFANDDDDDHDFIKKEVKCEPKVDDGTQLARSIEQVSRIKEGDIEGKASTGKMEDEEAL